MDDQAKLERKWAALEPWQENFDGGMEQRGADGYSWYDLSLLNSLPREKDCAIIVTAWQGQLKWLESTLRAYRETGAFVILAYDHHFFPWSQPTPVDVFRSMPNPRHYQLASATVYKHLTADASKRNGWFWSVRYAQGILRQFPNISKVYLTNGDCLFQRPEGFPELLKLADNCDLISGQTTHNGTIHTANVLFKREAFDKIFDYLAELMRVPVIGSRSPERNLLEAVGRLGLKLGIPPLLPLDKDGTVDPYCRYGQESTWRSLVGFRNIWAEYEQAANDGLELDWLRPYADPFMEWLYFSGEERSMICKYWETGDRRYLYQFWDAGEPSDYDRLYYPLEFYGKEPILS